MQPDAINAALSALLAETELRLQRVNGNKVVEQPELAGPDVAIISATASALLSAGDTGHRAPKLPEFRFAYTMRPYPHLVVVTALDPSSDEKAEVAPLLWWIACVRSRLGPVQRADLHAFILMDQRDSSAARWRSSLEGDDRFCRKLVWLVPQSVDELRDSARAFLDRTFLAQPWADEEKIAARGLDPFADLAESLSAGLEFPQGTIHDWLALLARPDLATRDLAEEMVRAAEGANGT